MTSIVTDLTLPHVGLLGDQSRAERHSELREIAKNSWIAKSEIGYSVLTYESVLGILRDKRWHSATGLISQLRGITDEQFLSRRRVSILNAEGDVHVRLRRLVAPAFSPRSAERLRPFMRETVNGLVDNVASRGEAEVVRDICEPYPIPIICELLGAPKEDWQSFSVWATDVLRIFSESVIDDLPIIMKAQDEINAYSRTLINERRDVPRDDLLTDLIRAESDGDKLSTEELEMMVEAVIIGGTDTTRNQLGLALALFAEHPNQWKLLAQQPELAPRAVEEVMRYSGAVGGTVRFASEDIEYNGVLFPKGTFVSVSLASGNFDSQQFMTPEVFDITRDTSGQQQLGFGAGIHYCLGASLARAELQESLVILSQRMPDLAVNGPVEFKPTGVGIFGPSRLPVRFTPTA